MNDSPDEEVGEGAAMAGAGQDAEPPAAQEDPMSTALAVVTEQGSNIMALVARGRALAEQYRNVAFDVTTTKGMDEAKKARLALREEVRYPLQKLKDARSKILGTMQRQANASADELIEEVKRAEAPIDEQITAEETRKENEKAERDAAEQRRRQAHIDAITAIARIPTEAVGLTSAELREKIVAAEGIMVDEGYEEFKGQATQAKDETLRQLNGLLMAAIEEEEELERTRQQQARLRQQQEEQAARQRELDEQEATLRAQREAFEKRQREAKEADEARQRALDEQAAQQRREREERAQAVQRRIDALSIYGAAYSSNAASVDIESALRTLNDTLLYAADYDARVSEAEQIKAARIASLRKILAEAIAREAEQARQQRAAEVQQRIDQLEVSEMQAGNDNRQIVQLELDHLTLADRAPTEALFGDRLEEAKAIYARAVEKLTQALVVIGERERQEAQAAEERRQQEADQAAARALVAAKQAHGEELYELVRKAAMLPSAFGDGAIYTLTQQARSLCARINPNETFED